MELEKDNFLSVLMENDEEKLKDYILEHGKKPKPHAPLYVIRKEEINDDK